MGKFIDLTGQRFGRLTVIERAENKGPHAAWLCLCDCGKEKIVMGCRLRNGFVRSCGCLNKELSSKRAIKRNYVHGKRHTRLYNIFKHMKRRCYKPKNPDYNLYGGRGITICDEWLNDFMSFYTWAMANGYDDTKSIDRIDNDKGYSPDNCRWATAKEQSNNRRVSIRVEYEGKFLSVEELSKKTGIKKWAIYKHLSKGLSIEKMLNTPRK